MSSTDKNGSPTKNGESNKEPAIDTGGGAYVAGNVDTHGGDFIGRDLIVKIAVPAALAVVLAASAAVVAVSTGWELPGKVQVALCPYAEEQGELPPGDFNIAIAPFAAPDPARLETGTRLSDWLAKQIDDPTRSAAVSGAQDDLVAWSNDWPKKSQIDPPMKPISLGVETKDRSETVAGVECKTDLTAEEWLARLRAHLVVFGELEDAAQDTELHLSFYFQAPVNNLPDITLDHHPFGSPIPIPNADSAVLAQTALDDSDQLDQRVEALVHLLGALASMVNDNPQAALRKFDNAVVALDLETWSDPQVSSTLYYYMGQAALQVPDLETARRSFQSILDHSEELGQLDIILATVGMGNVDYLQADALLLDTLARADEHFCFPAEAATVGENACLTKTFVDGLLADARVLSESDSDAHAHMRQLLDRAIAQYETALAYTDELASDVSPETVQEIRGVAQVMMAHAQRRLADVYLNEFEQQAISVEFDPSRLDQGLYQDAETQFDASTAQFSQTVEIFQELGKPGLVAFAQYGEGLVKERHACSLSLADPTGAESLYTEAADSFAACAELEEPTEDVSRKLFRTTQCLCRNAAGRGE